MAKFFYKTRSEKEINDEAIRTKALLDGFRENSISMAFQGEFSKDILALIAVNLKRIPNSQAISKKIFALVVEMGQNIHHYSDNRVFSPEYNREIGLGILTISETAQHFVVSSGNYISDINHEEIAQRFDEINHLDEEELKTLYKERRKMPQRKDKPGANLGFIDMRRKSGNPIDYMFLKTDEQKTFFILSVKVNKI